MQIGLFLNSGVFEGVDDAAALQLTVESARLAESLGYDRLWVSEHHFMDFGVCSQALTLAGYLLGLTKRIRVGTAVVLAPLVHPVTLAEQVALLDQVSDGRLDIGLGRGGYGLDYEVFDVEPERWSAEVEATIGTLIDLLSQTDVSSDSEHFAIPPVTVRPRPRSKPHPPIYIASASERSISEAARRRLPLQFHFPQDTESRVRIIEQYRECARLQGWDGDAEHLHAIPCLVDDDEATARERMTAGMRVSFHSGDHPLLPAAEAQHGARSMDYDAVAAGVTAQSPIGPPDRVLEWLDGFIAETGARNLALYMGPLGDPDGTLHSIRRFAADVAPHLRSCLPTA